MLHINTWLWGRAYGPDYVAKLQCGLKRHLDVPYRFIVNTDHVEGAPETVDHPIGGPAELYEIEPADHHLLSIPGCFARLRTFDLDWQHRHGVPRGDRIVTLDLDLIITGDLGAIFDRPEPFGILQGVNHHAGKFNGSIWWTTAGYRPDVWSDFSLDAAARAPHASFPDDQAWLEAKLPHAAAVGPVDGCYAFMKPGWETGTVLPPAAKIVAFPGRRDPSQFGGLSWVKEHWKC